ncbi:MAG: type I restriction endonuclease subunit R [Sandaracinaceae bacterium]|nr:type I restriction endonuclease subunit R [Sandaracinaceae bacterium]
MPKPPAAAPWNELGLSEDPAVELLQHFGYTYVSADELDKERASALDVVLVTRLEAALKRLNPWLNDGNLQRAVREVTHVAAASLLDANEQLYTTLTRGIAVTQDLGHGSRGQQVRYFDFASPRNNDLLVTRQLRIKGVKKHIIPDVVVYVNGVPLAVIECKSPTIGDKWEHEAIDQLLRYQELAEKYRDLGAPRLFQSVQLCVATCLQDAVYGTVSTPERFYLRWKEPWPHELAAIEKELGRKPTPQDVLLYGMLTPETLLDLVRNFVVFEKDVSTGKTVKKVPRYQQFAAVNKAIDRARTHSTPLERGGVVWHTQGSGKSITMLWLALKLRHDETNENPTILIVTDRRDLDDQISRTFTNCGYPSPLQATSVAHLRELLSGPSGKTVMTTVQKFQEIGGVVGRDGRLVKPKHPVLSRAENLFVLTDEAHRTQYGSLAGNLRLALPNAVFFGFTGTPIDKKDKSTLETFGGYIDKYTIEQAVKDGATVPIFYESRLPELRVLGNTLDKLFDRVFADRTDEERAAIKQKYATEAAIAAAPGRIKAICLDLVEHYQRAIEPNGFKAQVVAVSRHAAVTYKRCLDDLNAPESAVLYSSSNKDEGRLAEHATSEQDRKLLVKRFLDPADPLRILIVCDMLLTGFDAPIEQVMYLDSPLKEHTLLQAIARVNRTAENKNYGLVVDYWGVSEALQEALAIFAPKDVKQAMTPKEDELPRLETRHAAAMRFFIALKDKRDLDRCVLVLEPADVRAEFDVAFRRFAQSMDMLLPDPRALEYAGDLAWLGKIRSAAKARYREEGVDIGDCGDKVKKLIDEAIIADGIEILVKEVNLFSPDFEARLAALKSPEARASEMEHAIRHEIHTHVDEDPAFYRSLRERLEQILADYRARRIDAAKQLELFAAVEDELRQRSAIAEDLGLTETGLAIYGLLVTEPDQDGVLETQLPYGQLDEAKKALAEVIEEAARPHVRIVDWVRKEDVQREMRRAIKRHLQAASYSDSVRSALAPKILDLLKAREGR